MSPVVSPTKSKDKRIEGGGKGPSGHRAHVTDGPGWDGGGGRGGSSVVPRLALGDLGCGGAGGVLKEREKRSGREGSAATSRAGARAPRDVKGGGGGNDIAAGLLCGGRSGAGGNNDKIHFVFARNNIKYNNINNITYITCL